MQPFQDYEENFELTEGRNRRGLEKSQIIRTHSDWKHLAEGEEVDHEDVVLELPTERGLKKLESERDQWKLYC
jgi:ferritin-like protein